MSKKEDFVKFDKVDKSYDGKILVVKDLNLDIEEGEFVTMLGPSGSGKSTLMNMIGCLDTPTNGTYEFENEYVHEMDEGQLASIRNRKIGFVFQTFNLLPKSSALRNVEVPLIYANISKKERIDRAKESLIDVGLEDRMHHKPNELSGGEKQRVAVARALINEPSIILADEPSGNLDSNASNNLHELFLSLRKDFNYTFIIATHNKLLAKKSDRVLEIKDGKIK